MQEIMVQKLSRENFAPFGEVIECAGAKSFAINEGMVERFDSLASCESGNETDSKTIISIFRASPYKELVIKMMERHPLGSQAFIPLQNQNWLVVVAKDNKGQPGVPQAFLASGKQGVNYKKNTWHHPLITLVAGDYLVVDRKGKGNNLQEAFYEQHYCIRADKIS